MRGGPLIAVSAILCCVAGFGLHESRRSRVKTDDNTKKASRERPEVRVKLLGTKFTPEGKAWPGLALLNDPCNLTVALPSGRELRLPVKQVILSDTKGTITGISTLPLMQLVGFQTALSELRRILKDLAIEPDRRMEEMISLYENYGDMKANGGIDLDGLGTVIEEKALIAVAIRPDWEGKGWFFSLTFYPTNEAWGRLEGLRPRESKAERYGVLPELTVALSKPIGAIKGKEWVLDPVSKRPFSTVRTSYEDPRTVKVELPDGRVFDAAARVVFLDQRQGAVTGVHFLTLAKMPDYPSAVTELRRTLKGWGVDTDHQFEAPLARWSKLHEKPNYLLPHRTSLALGPEAELVIEVTNFGIEKDWYITYSITGHPEHAGRPR